MSTDVKRVAVEKTQECVSEVALEKRVNSRVSQWSRRHSVPRNDGEYWGNKFGSVQPERVNCCHIENRHPAYNEDSRNNGENSSYARFARYSLPFFGSLELVFVRREFGKVLYLARYLAKNLNVSKQDENIGHHYTDYNKKQVNRFCSRASVPCQWQQCQWNRQNPSH